MKSRHRQHAGTLVYAGHVGVPNEGERQCSACEGNGMDPNLAPGARFGGCDECDGTGVIKKPAALLPANQGGDK